MIKALGTAAVVFSAVACLSFAAGLPARSVSGNYMEARTADVYTGPCFANGEVEINGKEVLPRQLDGTVLIVKGDVYRTKIKDKELFGFKLVLDYAFGALNLPRVVAFVHPGNARSIALINRLGMRFDRVVRAFRADVMRYVKQRPNEL